MIAKIIDEGIRGGNVSLVVKYSLLLVLFAVLGLSFSVTAQYFAAKAATSVSADVRDALYRKIQSMS